MAWARCLRNGIPPARTRVGIVLALVALATCLAIVPPFLGGTAFRQGRLTEASLLLLGTGLLIWLPGYLIAQILFPAERHFTLEQIPTLFAFGLAVWAIPVTLVQLAGADWNTFRILFVLILWSLMAGFLGRVYTAGTGRCDDGASTAPRELRIAWLLLIVCAGVGWLVWRGARDADDWMYLQLGQQLLSNARFQPLTTPETRYTLRFMFHVWLFAQAYLAQWLHADLVTLVRDWLPTLLAPLALVSFYAWNKTFFQGAGAALLAIGWQLVIYVTFANGDGWGRGFFERAAQDKFLVWLVLTPVATSFAWGYLKVGKMTLLVAYGLTLLAGMWTHQITVWLAPLSLAGFALFNLMSRVAFPRGRWLRLAVVSAPLFAIPLAIRATTPLGLFNVLSSEATAYLRLSARQLILQPPLYLAHPALIAHPLILLALALLVSLAPRVRDDHRVQFLWGSTLLPLALLFNPLTAWGLGELFTPWQLWRFTWNLPAALILTEVLLRSTIRNPDAPTRHRTKCPSRRGVCDGASLRSAIRKWLPVLAVLGAVWGAFALSNLNLSRSLDARQKGHALDAPVEDLMRMLQRELREPVKVLLPRHITRYASAYSYNARVLSNFPQRPEDLGGQEIDRFYHSADASFLRQFIVAWEFRLVVVETDSPQDRALREWTAARPIYRNATYTVYTIGSGHPF